MFCASSVAKRFLPDPVSLDISVQKWGVGMEGKMNTISVIVPYVQHLFPIFIIFKDLTVFHFTHKNILR